MLSYDYFIQTHQYLLEHRRFKEAVDLCEYAISSAVWPSPMENQCEALCRWSLAETYFYSIGDAKSARESYTSFLDYVDKDWSIITAVASRREVMEDMYTKACFDMGQLAISYEEYFSFMDRSERARPLTQKQKQQKEAVQYNRDHGLSWCDNVVQLAELEAKHVESGNITVLPCAAALYSLFLLYPEIDPPVDILKIALNNYSSYVCRHIGESILHSAAKNHPANPDNYRFIFDQAIDLMSEFFDDMETDAAARDARSKLIDSKSESIDKSNFFNYGYASTAPANARGFIPPMVLQEQIRENLSRAGAPGPGRAGCAATLMIPILMLSGAAILIAAILARVI